jgi:hypothetical protein
VLAAADEHMTAVAVSPIPKRYLGITVLGFACRHLHDSWFAWGPDGLMFAAAVSCRSCRDVGRRDLLDHIVTVTDLLQPTT